MLTIYALKSLCSTRGHYAYLYVRVWQPKSPRAEAIAIASMKIQLFPDHFL